MSFLLLKIGFMGLEIVMCFCSFSAQNMYKGLHTAFHEMIIVISNCSFSMSSCYHFIIIQDILPGFSNYIEKTLQTDGKITTSRSVKLKINKKIPNDFHNITKTETKGFQYLDLYVGGKEVI